MGTSSDGTGASGRTPTQPEAQPNASANQRLAPLRGASNPARWGTPHSALPPHWEKPGAAPSERSGFLLLLGLAITRCLGSRATAKPLGGGREDGARLLLAGEALEAVWRPGRLAPAEPELAERHVAHQHRARGEQHRAPHPEQQRDALGAALDQR